jgi:hypothetical protein
MILTKDIVQKLGAGINLSGNHDRTTNAHLSRYGEEICLCWTQCIARGIGLHVEDAVKIYVVGLGAWEDGLCGEQQLLYELAYTLAWTIRK